MIYGSWVDSRALALAESVSYLWLLAALHAEERREIVAFGMDERNKSLVGHFFFTAVGDLHFGGTLHGQIAVVGIEIVDGQAFD